MPTPPRRTTATSAFGPIVPDAGYLVIYGLPYLDEEGRLTYGDLASTLDLNGAVIDPPTNNHQVWWRGRPFDQQKRQIRLGGGAHQLTVAADLVTDQSFSFKLQENGVNRDYRSFEEKVQTYLDAITAPAMAAYPEATPLRSGGFKVDALARQYGNWHAGLEPVPERITSANINRLAGFDFVLCPSTTARHAS